MQIRTLPIVLLAAFAASAPASAQSRAKAPAPERSEDGRRAKARTFYFRSSDDDADRPRIGIATSSSGARDTLGVLVSDVTEGGPAERAGIEEGDRITAINGVSLKLSPEDAGDDELQGMTARRLTRTLGKMKIGDEVELHLVRDGKPRSVRVKTVAASDLEREGITMAGAARQRPDRAALGIGLGTSGSRRDTLGILVSSVNSDGPAEKAGVEEGDRIVAVNGTDLRVPAADAGDWSASNARRRRLNREMEKVKAGDEVELRLYRGGQTRAVKVKAVRSRDIEGDESGAFMFDGMGIGGRSKFRFSVPPVPPVPPVSPLPPDSPEEPMAPLPPSAPRIFFMDSEDDGMRIRVAPRLRTEIRGNANREALRRMKELQGQTTRPRVRIEMDDVNDGVTTP